MPLLHCDGIKTAARFYRLDSSASHGRPPAWLPYREPEVTVIVLP